ncbi:LPS export ABC transporter permease LptF [Pandoraea pulmonicola]|uniref:Lipopolysaccharide export system permease protein LptF n=1 Tax=Pandoraea pulmonicola TaxID=93221 RepID=A0AAJ4ZAH2_PANPU|nr:LPS export ABC transporter permease LptF [Pandoraea pulmonicola]AJC21456.1 LPS export ABC transporter permease LptF [Pandoraea pulmonicola]SUA89774.1 Lipopolysaccharide export system permease protein lptF [Pandoraea pulmonicola]
MIFQRSLQRELNYTAGAVFMVLITVMLTTMMIRILGFAASGRADPRDVLVLIGLAVIGYLAVILIVTLFVSILFVLTRWYRDSEMVVWFASGLSITDFIKPVLRFAAPYLAVVTFCALVAWPWANQQISALETRFAQRDDVSMISPGQFRESASSHRVFFVETVSADATKVHNVFVSGTENGKVNVIVSKDGHIEVAKDGNRYIVLEKGRRYDGLPGQPDYRVMEFERYGVKIDNPATAPVDNTPTKGVPTMRLLREIQNPIFRGEIVWRVGLPLLALSLVLLAVPLAYQNPRHGRTINLVMAVLIYLGYTNLLSLSQAYVAQERLPLAIGIWLLHALALCVIVLLYLRRVRFRGLFGRRRNSTNTAVRASGGVR